MGEISFKNVEKIYPNGVQAVYDFNLKINDGEFVVLVGPSGCGKSTLLRMLVGLEEISGGIIQIDDRIVNDLPPKERDIAMVFQDYALYPHMTVYHNIALSLVLKHENSDEIHKRVMKVADILKLTPYLNRKPRFLSGGQRQRVALGRAIIRNPKVFLMDEPLSNLDAALRLSTRVEIKKLQEQLKTTTVYVTHDQYEALTLADKIVIMNHGIIQQIGTPMELYRYPENMFVGGFIGTPPMNFIKGRIKGKYFVYTSDLNEQIEDLKQDLVNNLLDDNEVLSINKIIKQLMELMETERYSEFQPCEIKINLSNYREDILSAYQGKEIILGVRPEDFITNQSGENEFRLLLTGKELLGDELILFSEFCLNQKPLVIKIKTNEVEYQKHASYDFSMNLERISFFDSKTTNRIKRSEEMI